jgi:hypothetical protein
MKKKYRNFTNPIKAYCLKIKTNKLKNTLYGFCFKGLFFLCLLSHNLIAQSPVHFFVSEESAEVTEIVCVNVTTNDFTDVISLQLPVKWNAFYLNNAFIQNEALSFSTFNINQEEGELRYIWEDASLENPISLDNGQVLFELCFQVIGGKGEDALVEIMNLVAPEFEPLVLDSAFNELEIEITNGVVMIADDCNGVPIFPNAICQYEVFDLNVDLTAQGFSVNDYGYWIIDGHIVTPSDEGNNIPDNSGTVFIEQVNSFFDEDYNEQLKIVLEDTLIHTFQYLYAFINCDTTTTEEFTLKALPQPESLNLDIPSMICYQEDLIIDLNTQQSGTFNLLFSINGNDSIFQYDSSSAVISFFDLEDGIELDFNTITNSETGCFIDDLLPEEAIIEVLDEFQVSLIDSVCNDIGTYSANYELTGGSGDFQVTSVSSGMLNDNIYSTDLLDADVIDTITITDNFCQETSLTFITNIACSCVDTATLFDLSPIISCSSEDIVPIVEESFSTGLPNPVTFFRIFSRDNTGAVDEIIFDTLVYDESNPIIPFSDMYENGRTYFALPFISERKNGEIDLNYRCINEVVNQQISFRFYRNPEPSILGDNTVCTNQYEVKYDASTDNNNNLFEWSVSGNAEQINVGNSVYINFEDSSPIDLMLVETYEPIDIVGDLSCLGQDQIEITVTDEVASDKIEIVLFGGGFFNALAPEDLCFKWIAVSKLTGEIEVEGPSTKEWIVGDDLDLDNLIYIVIVSNPVNGTCEMSSCPTYNYFNSLGPVSTNLTNWSEIELFPNPVHSALTIRHDEFMGNETIKVMNSVGLIRELPLSFTDNNFILQTDDLESGLYFIRISSRNNENVEIRKFIKF